MTQLTSCPIWGTPADFLGRSDYGMRNAYRSARAGGDYLLAGIGPEFFTTVDGATRAKLSTWIRDKNIANLPAEVTADVITKMIPRRAALSIATRTYRLLKLIEDSSPTLDSYFGLDKWDAVEKVAFNVACCNSECRGDGELYFLLNSLVAKGRLEKHHQRQQWRLTADGYAYLGDMEQANTSSTQAFVAMWFDSSMNTSYTEAIEPALTAAGYRALRIDKKDHNNKIDDEIIAEIRKSRFVVADFTSEPDKARGGVFFEAGFAIGLGLPVIWACRSDLIEKVHFDTRQFTHIVWSNNADLKTQLTRRIQATIGQGPVHA